MVSFFILYIIIELIDNCCHLSGCFSVVNNFSLPDEAA